MDSNQLSKKILLLLTGAIFSFIIVEIGARLYLEHLAPRNQFLKYASLEQLRKKISGSIYSPHRYLGHYPTPNYIKGENHHNFLGYRGNEIIIPKPREVSRIFCLGGSTTYTTHIKDYKLSYPALLQAELRDRGYENAEVINAGAAEWSSWESLINYLLRVEDLEPDMIIVYHSINDIHARLVWPPEAYIGDNSGHLSHIESMFIPSILEHSTAIRMLMVLTGIPKSHSDLAVAVNRSKNTSRKQEFFTQKIKGTYPEGIFEEVSAREMLNTNKPIYFKRNITNLLNAAKTQGIVTILATFAYSPLFTNEPSVSSEEYITAYKEMNGVIKEIARDQDVELFDFKEAFPEDKKYYTDGRHVTVEGSKLKAKLFADFVISNNLIPKHNDTDTQ